VVPAWDGRGRAGRGAGAASACPPSNPPYLSVKAGKRRFEAGGEEGGWGVKGGLEGGMPVEGGAAGQGGGGGEGELGACWVERVRAEEQQM
jgi:hypothetical protein